MSELKLKQVRFACIDENLENREQKKSLSKRKKVRKNFLNCNHKNLLSIPVNLNPLDYIIYTYDVNPFDKKVIIF